MHGPHFLVIGAAKSGTTTLFELLRQHPQLYMPPGKEDPFFSRDVEYRVGWGKHARRSFAGAAPDELWGTATPEYMAGTVYEPSRGRTQLSERTVPERIHMISPEVRLIAILRDPVERCISHHMMINRLGFEQRSVEQAVTELLAREELERSRVRQDALNTYVVWGEYGRILTGYYAVFSPEQIHVVFLDELASDPGAVMTSLYGHLGIDTEFVPSGLGRRYQPAIARAPNPRIDPYRLRRAGTRIRPLQSAWRRLPPQRRERIDRSFAELAYRTHLWTRTKRLSAVSGSSDLHEALGAHYAADGECLATLLGRQPPWALRKAAV